MFSWLSRRRNTVTKANARRAVTIEPMELRQMLSISVKFVNVDISSAAKAADATLSSLRTVDVQATVTSGDDFLAGDLLLRLTTGSFYNTGFGGNGPKPNLWSSFPHVQFDTFVAGPNFGDPTILGRKEGSGAAVFSPTEVNAAWGDLADTGAGTFTIARLTMTANATGTITGNVFANSAAGTPKAFSAVIKAAPPPVTTGSITGYVYNDQNGNGGKGDAEPKLGGWQVYIDANNNGKLNTGETSVKTRSNGNFTFSDVNAGNHRLRITLKDGWKRTAPTNSSFSHNVTVTAGATAVNKKFGVQAVVGSSKLQSTGTDAPRLSQTASAWSNTFDNKKIDDNSNIDDVLTV